MHVTCRAVQYHHKFAYRDTLVLVSQYPFCVDTSHDMDNVALQV